MILCRRGKIIGIALLIGIFLSIESKAEVIGIKPTQRFYSSSAVPGRQIVHSTNMGTGTATWNHGPMPSMERVRKGFTIYGGAMGGLAGSVGFCIAIATLLESSPPGGFIGFFALPVGVGTGALIARWEVNQLISWSPRNPLIGAIEGIGVGIVGGGLCGLATGAIVGAAVAVMEFSESEYYDYEEHPLFFIGLGVAVGGWIGAEIGAGIGAVGGAVVGAIIGSKNEKQ